MHVQVTLVDTPCYHRKSQLTTLLYQLLSGPALLSASPSQKVKVSTSSASACGRVLERNMKSYSYIAITLS